MRALVLLGLISTLACRPSDGDRGTDSTPPTPTPIAIPTPKSNSGVKSVQPGAAKESVDNRRLAGPKNYEEARRLLPRLFAGPGRSLYCDCAYDRDRKVDPQSCGLPSDLGTPSRRRRIEWEHVVPARMLGRKLPGWEGDPRCGGKTGRDCLRIVSEAFNRMEGDLHNLRPAVGSVNETRGSRALCDVPRGKRLGGCSFVVQGGRAEPRNEVKGDVARIYLDMNEAYPGLDLIDRRDFDDYERWSRLDPVDATECKLSRGIARLQGRSNQVVERACKKAGL